MHFWAIFSLNYIISNFLPRAPNSFAQQFSHDLHPICLFMNYSRCKVFPTLENITFCKGGKYIRSTRKTLYTLPTPLDNSILWHLIAMARDTYFWKGEDMRSSKQVLLKSYEFILGQEASVKAVSQGCLCSHGWTSFWAKIKIFLYKPILINIFHFMVENFFVYDFFDFI